MVASPSDKKSLLTLSFVFLFVIIGTALVTLLARGYRLDFENGPGIKSTGILSATSRPKGASVYLNDSLVTATDDTVNLPPGDYLIKIVKDGFLPWTKKIHIKKEVVYQSDAQLFRSVPDLKTLTLSGAINPAANPDNSQIVYAVASASATKDNGLYLVNTFDNPLNLNRYAPRQIAANFPGVDWSKFTFTFSPDSRQILATSTLQNIHYLFPTDTDISQKDLFDVTARLPLIRQDWDLQTKTRIATLLAKVPTNFKDLVATDSPSHLQFTSDDSKMLYLAASDSSLPQLITPPPAQSTQAQNRDLKKGNYYVYDIKDDTNYLISPESNLSRLAWLANSYNLVFVENKIISTVEYDNTNKQTLFAGSFDSSIVVPWGDGSKLVTLTSSYPGAPINLYTISIR